MGNSFRSSVVLFDLEKLKNDIASYTEEQNKESFWDDQKSALEVVNKLNDAKYKYDTYNQIRGDFDGVISLLEDPDASSEEMRGLIEDTETELKKKIHELRNDLLFTGEYDTLNATLEIHPGAGGTEAQDWADMLFRMYGRWAEKHHYKWQV